MVDARGDVSYEDVEAVVTEAAEDVAERLDEGRVRAMLRSIAEQGVGGALGVGITTGLGEILSNLPF